jgi:hypothetical protein
MYNMHVSLQRAQAPQPVYARVARAATRLKTLMDVLSRDYGVRLLDGIDDWIANRKPVHTEIDRTIAAAEARARGIKRGQPKKEGKLSVVYYAILLLRRYARPRWETRHPSDVQLQFIELFYETATGETNVTGKLEHQVRTALDDVREWPDFNR